MTGVTRTATVMAVRDQCRRPLLLALIVAVPAYVILWSVAETKATPRAVELPGGVWVTTTMKALHGPGMAGLMVAFVSALAGVVVARSALRADRRLVLAGLPLRVAMLIGAALLSVAVSALMMAIGLTTQSWPLTLAGLALVGLTYAPIGALIGALLDVLPATYLILFLVMSDLGVVQSPMFHATPGPFAPVLPDYAAVRLLYAGAFSPGFHAAGLIMLGLGWLAAAWLALCVVLRRAIGPRT